MKVRGPPGQKEGVSLRSRHASVQNPVHPRGKPNSLRGKRLFLDLKGYKGHAALENNLKRLGAVLEKCFSKEVEWLITNQGRSTDYKRSKKSDNDPETQDYVPSPFNLTNAGVDSPQAASPNSSQATKPITRGKAIAQAANLTKTYGSANLVDNARRWDIRIAHIEHAQKWVDNEIAKYREWVKLAEIEKKSQVTKVKRLKAPYLKFESCNEAYRPVFEHLSQLPELHFRGGIGGSPFDAHPRRGKHGARKEIDEPAEAEERDIFVKDQIPVLLSSEKESKATDSANAVRNTRSEKRKTGAAQPQLVTAGELRRKAGQVEKQTGNCEMCNLRYTDIDKHVLLDQHRKFVKNIKNYKALDAAIHENLTMVEVIEQLVKQRVETQVTQPKRDLSELYPEVKDRIATCSHIASPTRSASGRRGKHSGKGNDASPAKEPTGKDGTSSKVSASPGKHDCDCAQQMTPRSGRRLTLKKPLLERSSSHTNCEIDEVQLVSLSSLADNDCLEQEVKTEIVKSTQHVERTVSRLMSPKTAKRKSSRLSLVKTSTPSRKSPAPQTPTSTSVSTEPTTPCTPVSNKKLSTQHNKRVLRSGSNKEQASLRSTQRKRKGRYLESKSTAGVVGTQDELCIADAAVCVEEPKAAESKPQKFVAEAVNSISPTPKQATQQGDATTPNRLSSSTRSTPLHGSGGKNHKRKLRKLTLKKSITLASDHSMQKLLEDDDDEAFDGFDEDDVKKPLKNALSYEDVTEIMVDVDTLSDKEWDYDDLEKDGVTKVELDVEDCNGGSAEEEDGLDIGSVINSITDIGENSEPDWDEHLETFICDQLNKKQDCSATNLNLTGPSGNAMKNSPLKTVVLKSPKNTTTNPGCMFIYLSPRKKKSPAKLVFSPVKLSKSPGKLLWNPKEHSRKPLRQVDDKTNENRGAAAVEESAKVQRGHTGSVLKHAERRKFLKDCQQPSRNRFLSPSSGSVLSPSARLHRSLFTSPSEYEDELWSGPALDDKSKFAKEGTYYKPSTPKLSECLKENRSSTPKSYLRHFQRHGDSEGDRAVTNQIASTPRRRENKRLLSTGISSPGPSMSAQDSSVYEIPDDGCIEADVQIDDDISFNFSSPQKDKPSKVRRLNSDCGRSPVNISRNVSDTSKSQRDWLDDLDDPNLGLHRTVKEKSFFKHSPRSKKSYKFNYAAAAESKLPHWRKKYAHMQKSKIRKNVSKTVVSSTRASKRLTRDREVAKKTIEKNGSVASSALHNKSEAFCSKSLKTESIRSTFRKRSASVSSISRNKNGEVSSLSHRKSEAVTSLSFNASASNGPSDAPVSPRTRRNLLSLVVGIRQHNKVPLKDSGTASGPPSETGKEDDYKLTDAKELNMFSDTVFQETSVESRTVDDMEKMRSVRVSLKRLDSTDIKGRPTRACRRLLQS